MSELNNRMSAQRKILKIVNSISWEEELFGLSHKALNRWKNSNGINTHNVLALDLEEVASKLFFLANKSQDQITNEYNLLVESVNFMIAKIEYDVDSMNVG